MENIPEKLRDMWNTRNRLLQEKLLVLKSFWRFLWLGAWIGFWCLSKLTPCYWKSTPICMSQERSCSPKIVVACRDAGAAQSLWWGENIDFPAACTTRLFTLQKAWQKTCWFSGSSDWIKVAMTPYLLSMSFFIIGVSKEKGEKVVWLGEHSSLTHHMWRMIKNYI